MTLTDVTVVQAPDATKMNLDVHRELKIVTGPSRGKEDIAKADAEIGILVGGEFYTLSGDPRLSPQEQESQMSESYRSLKATQEEIDSGNYGFSASKLTVRRLKPDGSWEPVSDLSSFSSSSRVAVQEIEEQWTNYSESVKNTKTPVDVVPILNIDLSKFTSGASRAWCVYYIET